MSATDELRRMLDERGVEYKRHYLNTSWYVGMKLYMATDDVDGTLTVDNLTPEQAIAATLGNELNPDGLPVIVRCRDCKHATISTMGLCKYCEMFVLPDTDGYGADAQVNFPLDFFCAWGERE